MKVRIKKLHPAATIPTYGTEGAACFDLKVFAPGCAPANLGGEDGVRVVSATLGTGLSFEIPQGHVMLVFSRSGHGFNHDVRLANCVGVIDSDYRGEVCVRLTADTHRELTVAHGDRIAQAMIIPVEQVQFELADELSNTERGTGGFGSTGA